MYAENTYSITIVRGQGTKSDPVYKPSNVSSGTVKVTSATAPSAYTTYNIYFASTATKMTSSCELQNTAGNIGKISYSNTSYVGMKGNVYLKGTDARLTAPNYSTVRGMWSSTATL